jgi:hypothetical protein
MSKPWITIKGDKEFLRLCNELGKAFPNSVMRQIGRKGARVVVKAARVQIPGTLGSQIKKDIGVVNSRNDRSAVLVKLRSKYFTDKNGKRRVVSSIALHMTEGAKQHDRHTKKGKQFRGKVRRRHKDFIHEAGQRSQAQVMSVMQAEAKGVIERTVLMHRWQICSVVLVIMHVCGQTRDHRKHRCRQL